MTRALIVVESCFGNTRAVAEAVAAGLIAGGVEAQVVDVAQAPGALPEDLDLLVLGAPTHNRGLPTVATRSKARAQAGSGATSPGISEWLGDAEVPAALSVAAFDTVISKGWLSGQGYRQGAAAAPGTEDGVGQKLCGHGDQGSTGRRPGERRPQLGT